MTAWEITICVIAWSVLGLILVAWVVFNIKDCKREKEEKAHERISCDCDDDGGGLVADVVSPETHQENQENEEEGGKETECGR